MGARVVEASGPAHDSAETALSDLLLGHEIPALETHGVADPQLHACPVGGGDHAIRVEKRQRDGLLDQDRLAALERVEHRRRVLGLAGRDDDGVHFGAIDDFAVVAGGKLGAYLLGDDGGTHGVQVGDRDKPHARMSRRESCPQRPDPPRPDDRDAEVPLAHRAVSLGRWRPESQARFSV